MRYTSTGQCGSCYRRDRANAPDRPRCVHECGRAAVRRNGRCKSCHQKIERWGSINAAPGKGAPGKARTSKLGDSRRITSGGYVRVRTDDGRWLLEHRVVMQKHLGRDLLPDETVHHRDLNRQNNELSNLELWTGSHPTGQRVSDVVAWCREMLARYDDAEL